MYSEAESRKFKEANKLAANKYLDTIQKHIDYLESVLKDEDKLTMKQYRSATAELEPLKKIKKHFDNTSLISWNYGQYYFDWVTRV